MQLVKRIEIIANAVELSKILAALEQSGVHRQAVIRDVAGKGLQDGNEDLDMTMLDNVYVIAFCTPDRMEAVVNQIKPLLNKFGGTCHISDVMELRAQKCVAS